MPKYLAHLTANVSEDFNAGNFRGEPRFELNVVSATLSQGRYTHTTNSVWQSPKPIPAYFHDGINKDWLSESILISYGVCSTIGTGRFQEEEFKDVPYRVIQYLDGPNEQTKDTFLKHDRANPGSIVATIAFKAWEFETRLQDTLGKQNVEWVYGPTIPYTVQQDSYNNSILLWAYRNFCVYSQLHQDQCQEIFNRVYTWMSSDHTKQLVILAQPNNEATTIALQGDRLEWFLSFDFAKHLHPFKDRIKILSNINWSEVLDLMQQTKLVISPAEPFGGPPFEAAMFGIPTVLDRQTNAFHDKNRSPFFPELITADTGATPLFLSQLENLYYDPVYYKKHGEVYRQYVDKHATHKAYIDKIENIGRQRGWNI